MRGCVGGTAGHLVRAQVISGAFEQGMRWCAWAGIAAGYCLLVDARLCSFERILPHRKWAQMQDEAELRVKHCIGFGSCSVVY